MGWEESLKKLDGDVAAGRVSAEEYRRQRDELLAGAGQGARGADPFPPPFRWGADDSENTTVMRATGGDTSADATQVVTAGGSDATQVVPVRRTPDAGAGRGPSADPDSDRTQTFFPPGNRPAGPPQQAGPPPQATAPPWLTGPAGGGSQQPPAPPAQGWGRGGPDFFDDGPTRSRGKVAGLAVVVVLVVALAISGVLYFTSGDDPEDPAAGNPVTSTSEPVATTEPPAPRPEETSDVLADPPGDERPGGGSFDLAQLTASQAVSAPGLAALEAAGLTEAVLKTSTEGDVTLGAFAFSVADEAAATQLAADLVQQQSEGGLEEDGSRSSDGVTVFTSAGAGDVQYLRAVYVSYDRVVQLDSFGPDLAAAESSMDALLSAQLEVAPPVSG